MARFIPMMEPPRMQTSRALESTPMSLLNSPSPSSLPNTQIPSPARISMVSGDVNSSSPLRVANTVQPFGMSSCITTLPITLCPLSTANTATRAGRPPISSYSTAFSRMHRWYILSAITRSGEIIMSTPSMVSEREP